MSSYTLASLFCVPLDSLVTDNEIDTGSEGSDEHHWETNPRGGVECGRKRVNSIDFY